MHLDISSSRQTIKRYTPRYYIDYDLWKSLFLNVFAVCDVFILDSNLISIALDLKFC